MAKTRNSDPPAGETFTPQPPPPPPEAPDAPEVPDDIEIADDSDLRQLAAATYASWLWWVYRLRDADEMRENSKRNRKILCTKIPGPLDVLAIQKDYGGGTFEVWGFLDGKLKLRKSFDLDGARKVWTDMREVDPQRPSSAPDDAAVRILSARMETIERLLERIAVAPAAASPGLSVAELLKLLPMLQAPTPSVDPAMMLTQMVGIFKMGAEIRSDVDAPPTPFAATILDKLLPAVERLAGAIIARNNNTRPALPAASPQQQPKSAGNGSHAEVVGSGLPANPPGYVGAPAPLAPDPPPAESESAAAPSTLEQIRFTGLVDALARAIDEGDDPKDFASAVERMLTESELDQLTGTSLDLLMPQLEATVVTYPVFGTEIARPFVDAVLTELRTS